MLGIGFLGLAPIRVVRPTFIRGWSLTGGNQKRAEHIVGLSSIEDQCGEGPGQRR